MKNTSNIAVKIGLGLLIFIVFMILLSPVYIYRSVQVEIEYTSSAKAELSIAVMRDSATALIQQIKEYEHFTLEPASAFSCVRLEMPSDNRVGCIMIRFEKVPHHFKIGKITIHNGGEKYFLDLSKFLPSQKMLENVAILEKQLQVKPGRKTALIYPLTELLRINRTIDPVMFLYMLLLALLPAALVYHKTEVDLNCRSWMNILYSAAALFLLVIPILVIDYYSILSDENRLLNPFPEMISYRRVNQKFPQQFENWFSDRFTSRKKAISQEKIIFSPNLFGDFRYTNTTIINKNNWMYCRMFNTEEMFQNKDRFTREQLELCAENIQRVNDYLKQRNIRLYVMMTPDKERVYPEFYPTRYKQVHPESRLEQTYKFLSAKTNVKIIFPLYEIRKAKKKYRVYAKAGTHWTPRGAHVAFDMLLSEMKKDFPEIPSDQPNAEVWKPAYSADTDISLMAGFTNPSKYFPRDVLFQEEPQLKCRFKTRHASEFSTGKASVIEYSAVIPRNNGLKVFACTDSFWLALSPFMFPCANQMLRISWGNGLPFDTDLFKQIIDKQKPDAVIIETTERFLYRFLNFSISGD